MIIILSKDNRTIQSAKWRKNSFGRLFMNIIKFWEAYWNYKKHLKLILQAQSNWACNNFL